MQFNLFFLAPLASLLQITTGLPTETVYQTKKFSIVPLNETRYYAEIQASKNGDAVAKRDSCSSDYPYTQSDMDALIADLQSDGQTDYLPAGSSAYWTLGTAVICTYNDYVFDNTHVTHWEMGWAAGYIAGECCPSESSNPQCSGGSCTGQGDSGLSVIISTHNSASAC
ncbi:uncharacterized protein F4807DRAFT_460658 [Annulohypoxylon truncatum]|uniref:uncharacterized protein n=1 Tax=Annulohypoxylon truncatum TaxID=327061 RepID=UPI002008BDD6|nr:uncharacterized protein F4807DRAFT_460658 [Annulohypoxylon truncatum]KAI1209443.1 hypothetical protein F4807DRAFT_460658 [Annulohypoxylon truncatum]